MESKGDSLVDVLLTAVEGEGDAAAAWHYRNHLARPAYTLKALHGDELEQQEHVFKNHRWETTLYYLHNFKFKTYKILDAVFFTILLNCLKSRTSFLSHRINNGM